MVAPLLDPSCTKTLKLAQEERFDKGVCAKPGWVIGYRSVTLMNRTSGDHNTRSLTDEEAKSLGMLKRFAAALQDPIGATRVLLFGSQVRSTAQPGSDYNIIVVAPSFQEVHPLDRGLGLRDVF